jgi:hypothetical protein
MKIRLLSTLATLVSVAGMANAHYRADTRVITMVRDNSGIPVQGASLKFFGPLGVGNRRSEMSTFTGRNGDSDKMMAPGRYLVFASDNERGNDTRTFDVSNRGAITSLDLRLRTTRRPTIQFVVMSDDRNEPVSNANIEVVNRGTGKRDSLRSNGSGITPYELVNRSNGGKFEVRISSADFDTTNVNISFVPNADTSSTVAYVQLRRKTGLNGGSNSTSQSKDQPKIDGIIRLTNKDRIEAGDVVPINVGLYLSKGFFERSQCNSTVNISGPNGSGLLSDARTIKFVLNEYTMTTYDFSPKVPGTYTVTVVATMPNGSRDQNSRWDGKFTFNVHGQSAGSKNSGMVMDRGSYLGNSDIEMDNKDIKSHILSLSVSKGSRNLDTIKGWLSPKAGSGFHMLFEGSFDQTNGRLDAKGTITDREDKRWEIRLTGSPDRTGRMAVRLAIRALDNSYNRTFNYTLAKQ